MRGAKTVFTAEEFYEIGSKLGHRELVNRAIVEIVPAGLTHGKPQLFDSLPGFSCPVSEISD